MHRGHVEMKLGGETVKLPVTFATIRAVEAIQPIRALYKNLCLGLLSGHDMARVVLAGVDPNQTEGWGVDKIGEALMERGLASDEVLGEIVEFIERCMWTPEERAVKLQATEGEETVASLSDILSKITSQLHESTSGGADTTSGTPVQKSSGPASSEQKRSTPPDSEQSTSPARVDDVDDSESPVSE